MRSFTTLLGCGIVAVMLYVTAEGGGFAERLDASFVLSRRDSIIGAADCGLVNGHISFNGWIEDVVRIQGLWAQPYFSANFVLKVRFDGREAAATDYTWRPESLVRVGTSGVWQVTSRLSPLAGARGGLMAVTVRNTAATNASLSVSLQHGGTADRCRVWTFLKPAHARHPKDDPTVELSVASSLGASGSAVFADVPVGGERTFHVAFALEARGCAAELVRTALGNPERAFAAAVDDWKVRVGRLASRLPEFDSDNEALVKTYCRSLLHLLLVEWDVPELKVRPYYATGGMAGGCTCCYLWNYGGPFRLWPLLDPVAFRAHFETFLALNLDRCYAFAPADGSPLGPYYPVNQEKMLFLLDAYVRETGDVGYLQKTSNGKRIVEWAVAFALDHDDLSNDAALADYGSSKSHLELRTALNYTGVMPDLNLRRVALLHVADGLCRLAKHDPGVDLVRRADALRALVRKELWDDQAGWFRVRSSAGSSDLRWTIQMFKAFGWKRRVLDADVEERLVEHLTNTNEFLGAYGVHSLAKTDPAYNVRDVDNGGPGACPSFPTAIAERLYRDGRSETAWEILRRLLWLGDALPYWGDSQYADRRDYRRDTPLQCDVEGACFAQAVIFGMFGVSIGDDLTVTATPALPAGTDRIAMRGLHLLGRTYSITCTRADGTSFVGSD